MKETVLMLMATAGVSLGALILYMHLTKQTMNPKKIKKQLRGMQNLGNTCFANALLQSLASCSSFSEWFRKMASYDVSNMKPSSSAFVLLRQLHLIVDSLNSADAGDMSAEGVINALRKHNWILTPNTEHDLFELLTVFITTWDEEISHFNNDNEKITSLVDVKSLNDHEMTALRGRDFLNYLTSLKETQSIQRSPCSGLLATQFHCRNCGHKYVRHDKFCNLSLSLAKGTFYPSLTLDSCLKKYFAVEKLFNVTCESCNEKSANPAVGQSQFYKRQGFSKLPDCLILQIERLGWLPSGVRFKQNDFVEFPEFLDVRDFVFYRSKKDDYNANVVGGKTETFSSPDIAKSPLVHLRALAQANHGLQQQAIVSGASVNVNSGRNLMNLRYKYRLNAVVVHLGDERSGHFVTYRRGPAADYHSWYLTSDLEIRNVSFQEVTSSEAYMLFYERVVRVERSVL